MQTWLDSIECFGGRNVKKSAKSLHPHSVKTACVKAEGKSGVCVFQISELSLVFKSGILSIPNGIAGSRDERGCFAKFRLI